MSFVGGSHAKGRQLDRSRTMPTMASTGGFLCWESDSTCINLDAKVDVIGRIFKQKMHCARDKVCSFPWSTT
jgi:hypothetical protein